MGSEFGSVHFSDLEKWPGNARSGDIPKIRESIREHGFVGVLVVQRSTNRIIIGNHRFEAGLQEGMLEFPCQWYDCDDERASKLNLIDNRVSDLASWDFSKLFIQLDSLDDLEGSGFTDDEVVRMGNRLAGELTEDLGTDEIEKPDSTSAPSDAGNVIVQIGHHKFSVDRDLYEDWEAQMYSEVGSADVRDIEDEIRGRLGL